MTRQSIHWTKAGFWHSSHKSLTPLGLAKGLIAFISSRESGQRTSLHFTAILFHSCKYVAKQQNNLSPGPGILFRARMSIWEKENGLLNGDMDLCTVRQQHTVLFVLFFLLFPFFGISFSSFSVKSQGFKNQRGESSLSQGVSFTIIYSSGETIMVRR